MNVLEALFNDPYRDVPPIYTAGEYVYIILKREKSMFSLVYEFENEVGSWFILYSNKMFDIHYKFSFYDFSMPTEPISIIFGL